MAHSKSSTLKRGVQPKNTVTPKGASPVPADVAQPLDRLTPPLNGQEFSPAQLQRLLLTRLHPVTPLERLQVQQLMALLERHQRLQQAQDALFRLSSERAAQPTLETLREICPLSSDEVLHEACEHLKGTQVPVLFGLTDDVLTTLCVEIRERSLAVRDAQDMEALMPKTVAHLRTQFPEQAERDCGWALWMVAQALKSDLRGVQKASSRNPVDDVLIKILAVDELKTIPITGKRPETDAKQLVLGFRQDFQTFLDTHQRRQEVLKVMEQYQLAAPLYREAAVPDPMVLKPLQQLSRDIQTEIHRLTQDIERALARRQISWHR